MGLIRLVAIIVLVIATLALLGVFTLSHALGWLAVGLTLWCISGSYDHALPVGSIGRRRTNPPVQ
jgi:hypothetical protein